MIVGLVGRKRAGKDTIGEYLNENYSCTRYSFASPIKKIGEVVFGWDNAVIEKDKEGVDPVTGISYREFYQWLGTEVFQFHISERWPTFASLVGRRVWVKRFLNMCKPNKHYVVTDMRFPHEDEECRSYCEKNNVPYLSIKIERDGLDTTDAHPSESEVDKIKTVATVYNNGTKHELFRQVDTIMKAFKAEHQKGV